MKIGSRSDQPHEVHVSSLTSIAAVPGESTVAFTVGLPESREPARPMLALDHLAGVKEIFFFITKDPTMALQALTAVGEGIDGQAGPMYTSSGEEKQRNVNTVDRGCQKLRRLGKHMSESREQQNANVSISPPPPVPPNSGLLLLDDSLRI